MANIVSFAVSDEQRRAFEEGLTKLPFIAAAVPHCFERRPDGFYAAPFVEGAFQQFCLQEIAHGHLEAPAD